MLQVVKWGWHYKLGGISVAQKKRKDGLYMMLFTVSRRDIWCGMARWVGGCLAHVNILW